MLVILWCILRAFVVQTYATGTQATLHLFVLYYRSENEELCHNNFTNDCGGQYNRCNFYNLCHRFGDFGLEVEWKFFATSHGKSARDVISGTVTR